MSKRINVLPFILICITFLFTVSCKNSDNINNPTDNKYKSCIEAKVYFGLSNQQGAISDSVWNVFVKNYMLVKLPSGFTITDCDGVWKECDTCPVVTEKSKLMILVFADSLKTFYTPIIEDIAHQYKTEFMQQSVLITKQSIDCYFN